MCSVPQAVSVFVLLAVSFATAGEEFESDWHLEEFEEKPCAVEKPYSFKLGVSPMGGYNSNVITLGDGLPLPEGVSHEDAGFFEIGTAATFDWKAAAVGDFVPDQFTASYKYTQDFYQGISGYDLGEHSWSAKYTHRFNKQWDYNIEADDIYDTFDGHSYSNRILIASALDFEAVKYASKAAKQLTTGLVFSFGNKDVFFTPSIPARNTDADKYVVQLSEVFVPLKYDAATFTVCYLHFWNDAEGSDYDYARNRLQFRVDARFSNKPENRWYDLKATINYSHDFDCYDHPNSHAGPTGFAFKKRDNEDTLG